MAANRRTTWRKHAAFHVCWLLAGAAVLPVGCGRSGLGYTLDSADFDDAGNMILEDGAVVDAAYFEGFQDASADEDAGLDVLVPTPGSDGGSTVSPDPPEPSKPTRPGCTPTEETCNGADDDCDGEVDEDLAPVPCPGGGFRYCVAGRMSQCPQRCEECMPGTERICYNNYCTYWGVQTCASDGRGFGACREGEPPPECRSVARQKHDSPELEQCCIDNGYCCLDEFDLDADGDRREMIGYCDEVECRT